MYLIVKIIVKSLLIRERYKAPYEFCCVYDCGNHEECKICRCDMYRELGGVAGFGAYN